MWLLLGLLALLVVLVVVYVTLEWVRDVNRPGAPPGDKGVPLFYNYSDVSRNVDRFYDYLVEQTLRFGKVWSYRLSMMTPRKIVVADPACVEYMLKDNWQNYLKGAYLQRALREAFGDGIFNVNGSLWKMQRQLASHMFTVKELKSMNEDFTTQANILTNHLEHLAKEGSPVDTQSLFARCTLDSICRIAFGVNIDSLHKDVPFANAFNQALLHMDSRGFSPIWQYTPWTKKEKDYKKMIAVLDSFAYNIIAERRLESEEELEKRRDLLARFMLQKDENGNKLTDVFLRDMVLNIIIAGRDTTAQTLIWAFYLLSQNERVENKLVDEINQTFPLGTSPTFEDLKLPKMKYLQAVIDETLRMYPPVPVDWKSCVVDDVLPNGHVIKKGDEVEWHAWVMGRHPDFWDCPTEFRPERWYGENGGKPVPQGNRPPFVPFQYGPRTCLGIQYAYLEVKIIMILILQRFRLRLLPGSKPMYKSSLTISVKDAMMMTVKSIA